MSASVSTELVAVDIGGTHARFALATLEGGKVTALDEPVTLKTAEHASFQTAWQAASTVAGVSASTAAMYFCRKSGG